MRARLTLGTVGFVLGDAAVRAAPPPRDVEDPPIPEGAPVPIPGPHLTGGASAIPTTPASPPPDDGAPWRRPRRIVGTPIGSVSVGARELRFRASSDTRGNPLLVMSVGDEDGVEHFVVAMGRGTALKVERGIGRHLANMGVRSLDGARLLEPVPWVPREWRARDAAPQPESAAVSARVARTAAPLRGRDDDPRRPGTPPASFVRATGGRPR